MSPRARACTCYLQNMTRKQVARKLGKSIATVRALEGVHLHPVEDDRGVWRFDPEEVERVAGDIQSGRLSLWETLQHGVASLPEQAWCANCAESKKRVEELQAEVFRGSRAVELLESQLALERAKHALQRQAWEAEVAEFVAATVDALGASG